MQDISSHILDIAQNSIVAKASFVKIYLEIDKAKDILSVYIEDNGSGMSEEMLNKVTSPFVTSRTTRKMGFGISFLKAGCEGANGSFDIKSQIGVGTKVYANYQLSNIDRPPLGEIAPTLHALIQMNPALNFDLRCKYNSEEFIFATTEIKEVLGDVPLDNIEVSMFILENLTDSFKELFGGKELQ